MNTKRKMAKYILAIGSFLLIFPVVAKETFFQQDNLLATSGPFSEPTFRNGDEVNLGDLTFTTLSTENDIQLLSNEVTTQSENGLSYADAQASLQNMSDDYGTLGATLLQGITKQPTKADLLPYTISDGTKLNSSIPHFSKDWWLGDAPLNYRASFVSADNKLNKPVTRTQTAFAADNSCTTEDVIEHGVKQSETRVDEKISMEGAFTGRVDYEIENTFMDADLIVPTKTLSIENYTEKNCTGIKGGSSINTKGGFYSINMVSGKLKGDVISLNHYFWAKKSISLGMPTLVGTTFQSSFETNVCYNLDESFNSGHDGVFKSIRPRSETVKTVLQTVNVKKNVGDFEIFTCPGQPQTAGLSSVRPYVSLPQSMVALGNADKRTYTPNSSVSNALPTSNGTSFLTLQAPSLDVSLTPDAYGVNGNELTVDVSKEGVVSIPVSLSGNAEGNVYVSAIADDKSNNKVYGVLGKIDGTEGTLNLNVSNLVDLSSAKEVNLTLFQENEGSYNTSYIGTGTPITIKFLEKQEIEFDASQAKSVTYGDELVVTSNLKSALNDQAETDITYSIVTPEGQEIKAEIVRQSYDRPNGKATATLRPLTGTGTFTVAIHKDGKSNGEGAANPKTMEITLEQKAIDVTPNIPSKVYKIGEGMPSFSSITTGLVGTDELPTSIIPVLSPLGSSASRPDSGGKISEVGTWKMTYSSGILDGLTQFNDKYNANLIGYDDAHKNFVFETGIDAIPSDWIVISPDANDDGWNKGSVTISPSATAKAAGYTIIEVLNGSNQEEKSGETITYSEETIKAGMTPKIRLKKGETTSNATNTRTIKIDRTLPSGSIVIADENEWVDKETGKLVSVSASDALSGIKSVTASLGGTAVTLNENGNSTYSFTAKVNGEVIFTITDLAGNEATIKKNISKIEAGEISIRATPQDNSADKIKQLVAIVNDPGSSGVKGFNVYYKKDKGDAYVEIQDLGKVSTSFNYTAQMNGWYQFEIENNAGSKASAEVQLTTITPPTPVTKIDAVLNDKPTAIYANDTWTNQDVLIKLKNINDEITDDVTWTVSLNDGITYVPVNANGTYLVSTADNTTLNETYLFKAKSSLHVEESTVRPFTVKIDKTKPDAPIVVEAEKYASDAWFSEDVTIETTLSPRPDGAPQVVYYQVDGVGQWLEAVDGKYTVSGNGQHQIVFKVIDEAGNESAETAIAYVNINSATPTISISLQGNPIKELINELTFGFFYKENVDVTIDVNYGLGGSGEVFYIIEDAEGSSMPEDTDSRWTKGDSTSIAPEKKVMIYAKAVSDSGIICKNSSIYYVVADAVKPDITLPANASTWSDQTSIEVRVSDANAGINPETLEYSADDGPFTKLTLVDQKAHIDNLSDGDYEVRVKVKDYSENEQKVSTTVKIDTVDPEVSNPASSSEGWAKKKTISFSADDDVSGISDELPVVSMNAKNIKVVQTSTGKYAFDIVENGVYSIVVKDRAGNEVTKTHTEAKVDTIKPDISNKTIDDPNGWKPSKKVSFDAVDRESGIASVSITYTKDGVPETIIATPETAPSFYFNATQEATYTITVVDAVGNQTTDSIVVSNIDAGGLSIDTISDIHTWTKDNMNVSFGVNAGPSGLATGYPMVTYNGSPLTLKLAGTKYTFEAVENGEYTMILRNQAGEEDKEVLNIQKIDKLPPVIDQVSSNTTSDEYRGPQVISFHVNDINAIDPILLGSGMKSGYPKVYYLENGNKKSVGVTQDPQDKTFYKFTASRNTTYVVEAMDIVEHPLVKRDIVVDHILNPSDVSEVNVIATSKGKNISSNAWVNGDVTFTISGGLTSDVLSNYQVAMSDGVAPSAQDWLNISNPEDNQHIVTDEQKNKTYWFRAVPLFDKAVSKPFVVNLDNTPPQDVQIHIERKHADPISRLLNTLSFGAWLKEEQVVSFEATDNYTDASNIKFLYVEETDAVQGSWKPYKGTLSYLDMDIKLIAKAIDLAGNESAESDATTLQIDTVKPRIAGVEDKSVYKFYYVKRTITYFDELSGIDDTRSTITSNGRISLLTQEYQVGEAGEHEVEVYDKAGNDAIVHFKLVPLPNIETEIDGSDESKEIIDQVQKELDEEREHLIPDEIKDYEDWLEDAREKWENMRKKVVEDENKTSKVEGVGDTTFDPKTVLVVEPIDESSLPKLPRKALYNYNVYLLKGNTEIQPNGDVKVFLPYDDVEEPIVYEIDADNKVSELDTTVEPHHVIFTTEKLLRYSISNVKQPLMEDMKVPGPDGKEDTADDVIAKGSDEEEPLRRPDGGIDVPPGGSVVYPDGDVIETPDGGILHPDGSLQLPNGDVYDPNGDKIEPDDNICVVGPDGKPGTADDVCGDGSDHKDPDKKPDGSVEVPPGGNVIYPDGGVVDTPDGGIIHPDGSLQLPNGDIYDPEGNKKTCKWDGINVNVDSDDDGMPDLNVDMDGDCEADINIDADTDGQPETNIDSDGDGKPDYNIDVDGDGKADINIGPVRKPWKPSLCKKVGKVEFCTDPFNKAYINIDTDHDGRPDINLDVDNDLEPDLNIDLNYDNIPDIDIDTHGNTSTGGNAAQDRPADGKPDINVDVDHDGIADLNLVKLTIWTPDTDSALNGFKYDTMSGLKPVYNMDTDGDNVADENLADNSNNQLILSGGKPISQGSYTQDDVGGAGTGDDKDWSQWWIMMVISASTLIFSVYRNVRMKRR